MRYQCYYANKYKSADQFRHTFQGRLTPALRLLFPRMYIGKEADLVKGSFSVFLAVDSAAGVVPLEIQQGFLSPLRLTYSQEVDYESVVKVWGVDADRALDFSRLARVADVKALEPDDPFAEVGDDIADGPSSMGMDQLFLWMSATGRGSHDAFRRTCMRLGVAADAKAARRLLRNLRLLGHIEVSDDGASWCVVRPTLVQRDHDEAFFLAGARDVTTRELLEKEALACCGLEMRPQEGRVAPKAILLTGMSEKRVMEILRPALPQVVCAGRASHRLLEALPDIEQGETLFTRVEHADPYMHELRLYDVKKRDFKPVSNASKAGLYELKSPRRPDLPPTSMLHVVDPNAWYRGDWYGLRFLARCQAGERCSIAFDEARGLVAIPEDWHLPELYERALVLASGLLPKRVGRNLVYSGCSRETVDLLAHRLDATVEEHGIA